MEKCQSAQGTGLKKSSKETLTATFKDLDKNKDGKVSVDEIKKGLKVEDEVAASIIHAWDEDGDKLISLDGKSNVLHFNIHIPITFIFIHESKHIYNVELTRSFYRKSKHNQFACLVGNHQVDKKSITFHLFTDSSII
uniref:EF-hand domain-containing protein n=1 Tax=Eptatretus burgeri TaxID=7764 RepID=A0A8C4QE68_EPTBU